MSEYGAVVLNPEAIGDPNQTPVVQLGFTPPETDTLPQWLYWRFGHRTSMTGKWEGLDDGDQEYWRHEADAVRRAVKRNGFKHN